MVHCKVDLLVAYRPLPVVLSAQSPSQTGAKFISSWASWRPLQYRGLVRQARRRGVLTWRLIQTYMCSCEALEMVQYGIFTPMKYIDQGVVDG